VRFVVVVLIAALALALAVVSMAEAVKADAAVKAGKWSSTAEVAKVDATVKTGRWSYTIEGADPRIEGGDSAGERGRGRGKGAKICGRDEVEVTWGARSVAVTMYNCTRAVVEVGIRSDATVPICLTPQGPVEGGQRIWLRPGDAVWRTFVFVDNGTLTFSVSVGTC